MGSILKKSTKDKIEATKKPSKTSAPVIPKNIEDFIESGIEPEKKGRGRPATGVKKQKMTFELSADLVQELDQVVKKFGMTRASFMSQAVMRAVQDAQK